MDGAFFVSRSELLGWANSFFRLNLAKVEQCSNGAVYCQVIDACHPSAVAMKKVNWAARADHESIPNFKVLQQAFDRVGIQRHVEVDKLVRGKYQDNLEMLQWIKTYFDRTFAGVDYDALARRSMSDSHSKQEWARPTDGGGGGGRAAEGTGHAARPTSEREAVGSRNSGPPREAREARQGASGYGGVRPGTATQSRPNASAEVDALREDHERLREEVVDLKITVDGLETERDFYFQKLRDIEILCQALEANPDSNMSVPRFVEDVQRILYAKDEEEEEISDPLPDPHGGITDLSAK